MDNKIKQAAKYFNKNFHPNCYPGGIAVATCEEEVEVIEEAKKQSFTYLVNIVAQNQEFHKMRKVQQDAY